MVQQSALSFKLQHNLGLQLFSMLMLLNTLNKLQITFDLNSAFPNTLIIQILNPTSSWLQISLHV